MKISIAGSPKEIKKLIGAFTGYTNQLSKDEFYDRFSSDFLNDSKKSCKHEHRH